MRNCPAYGGVPTIDELIRLQPYLSEHELIGLGNGMLCIDEGRLSELRQARTAHDTEIGSLISEALKSKR